MENRGSSSSRSSGRLLAGAQPASQPAAPRALQLTRLALPGDTQQGNMQADQQQQQQVTNIRVVLPTTPNLPSTTHHLRDSAYWKHDSAKPRIDSSVLYMPMPTPGPAGAAVWEMREVRGARGAGGDVCI